ncbi:hypothetical protein ACFQ2K_10305 [Streptomyces sanglieri]|uniref:Uncharacterized protein n=1 Tax=Streptomyces sanglieri TaxID=193460 RepID=A0ABW2WUD2_9ACTN
MLERSQEPMPCDACCGSSDRAQRSCETRSFTMWSGGRLSESLVAGFDFAGCSGTVTSVGRAAPVSRPSDSGSSQTVTGTASATAQTASQALPRAP